MHELGIVIELMKLVEEIQEEQSLKKVNSVTVEIGELSGVIPDYFKECWNVARLGSFLETTELKLNIIPAVALCSCGQEYEMTKNSRICPYCKKTDYTILHGKEFIIKEIEAC